VVQRRVTTPTKRAFPVKRISHHQSRRNRAKRQRKVAALHAQAGRWKAQPEPMFTSGTIHYEIGANTDAMSFGGMGAVHRLVTKLGLAAEVDLRLELLKVHLPYHESDHVLNLAYNVLCGGTRLEDIERLRHDTAYMNALGADLIPDLVEPHAERICMRGDTDFSLTTHFDRWAERADFLFGMDASPTLVRRAEALDEACWQRMERKAKAPPLTDSKRQRFQTNEKERIVRERRYLNLELNHEDVAEFSYQPGKCERPYRVVALRKNIIEQLKNGVNALRVPLYDLVSNWAYRVMATLAWNIKSWFAMMMHRKSDRRKYIGMEFPRFLHSVILIPCRVIRRARSITLRLIGYQPALDRLFSAWRTIERTGFG